MSTRDVLAAAQSKLEVAVRNEWIDKVVLTGDEARALAALLAQLPIGEES